MLIELCQPSIAALEGQVSSGLAVKAGRPSTGDGRVGAAGDQRSSDAVIVGDDGQHECREIELGLRR